mmetsp:Transcript_40056/g.114116  ORF Transcript_40056/g.114116 Transcript_40056/m.114116 type:complete len:222 (+) Transcript_40056:1332-1997(+)
MRWPHNQLVGGRYEAACFRDEALAALNWSEELQYLVGRDGQPCGLVGGQPTLQQRADDDWGAGLNWSMAIAKKVGHLAFMCLQTHMAFRPALKDILKPLVSLERQLCGDIDRTIRMHKNIDVWLEKITRNAEPPCSQHPHEADTVPASPSEEGSLDGDAFNKPAPIPLLPPLHHDLCQLSTAEEPRGRRGVRQCIASLWRWYRNRPQESRLRRVAQGYGVD